MLTYFLLCTDGQKTELSRNQKAITTLVFTFFRQLKEISEKE